MKPLTVRLLIGMMLALLLAGVGPAAAQAATDTVTVVHTVRWGETVEDLAAAYGVSVGDVAAANRLTAGTHARAGQQLIVPHVSRKNSQPHSVAAAPSYETVHVVQPGETLSKISVRYGVPMADIIAANNILNPSRIYSGQRLIIPVPGTTQPAQATVSYTVQRGEYLSQIANRFGVSVASILQANNISNPSLLYVGQVLTIPGSSGAPSPAQPAPQPAPQPIQTTTYVIQPGDTLQSIAYRHGTTVAALMQANQIADMNRIFWGQTLVVSGSAAAPAPAPSAPAAPSSDGKLILVDLSEQRVYAYEDGALLNQFVVSTGLPAYPTVTGTFSIYVKYRAARMRGPGYDLPNVPYVMYFYSGYGLHGTYWHNNFGVPMSHGCVNLRTPDAEWIYNWAPVGTTVQVVP